MTKKRGNNIQRPGSAPNITPRQSNPQSVLRARYEATELRGPLPPPEILAKYNEVIPGAAERIFAMAEKQSNHRQLLEKTVVQSGSRDSLLGVIFAFIICILAILTGGYVVLHGYATAGSVISCTGLGGIVTTFIYGTRSKKEELAEKRKTNMDT